jgi:hypothetical protein
MVISREIKDVEQLTIECCAELIHKYGIERLTLNQIAKTCKAPFSSIQENFDGLNSLLVVCLQTCESDLSAYLLSENTRRYYKGKGIEEFWMVLVDFIRLYNYKAGTLYKYLDTPSSFPIVNLKNKLMRSVNGGFNTIIHHIQTCNGSIRFVAFKYLFQMAWKANQQRIAVDLYDTNSQARIFFQNNIEKTMRSIMILPIC